MLIYGDQIQDPYRYNTPTASDIVAIMINDGYDVNLSNRDILLRLRDKDLQRISEFHLLYNPLYYILLFLRGNDGWHVDVPLIRTAKRERMTMMQFYSYRLQIKDRD